MQKKVQQQEDFFSGTETKRLRKEERLREELPEAGCPPPVSHNPPIPHVHHITILLTPLVLKCLNTEWGEKRSLNYKVTKLVFLTIPPSLNFFL